jgi:hypothetical protein
MNLSFYLYLFLAIASITGGSYYFFKSNNSIAGSIYLISSIIIAAFFGARWFLPSGVRANSSGLWPPVINVCPDFMSLVTLKPESTGTDPSVSETVCVDTIGVYSNGIAKWSPGSTSENTIFHLFANLEGTARKTALCDQSKTKNVTWEGFYTEGTCGSRMPPLP